MGVDINKKRIENGIERLGINSVPHNKQEMLKLNEKTIYESADRNKIRDVWNECINDAKSLEELTKQTIVSRKRLRKDLSFFESLSCSILLLFLPYFIYNLYQNIAIINKKSINIFI